ncbi:hypothetical protein P9D47_07885 [Bacillus haynesii]|uniref:hypothetical protein n=1 Tax=Bacillus haynesii TaxID=1925021 RepID=UPI0015949753|nr:hypothetical protein [Bacillus haynesii]MEC0671332.1 hypothetical protein [Bacillus haynesii]MEC1419699.1 hypothetical protein [Bacillus haynesii]MEC1467942.1 hypothetical protein [Bacillus haynesii]NVB35597.1 hypothetical protein [Bacillus licheniformis]
MATLTNMPSVSRYVKKLTKISPTLSQIEVSADKFKLRNEVKKETVEDIQAKNIKIDKEIEKKTKKERGDLSFLRYDTFTIALLFLLNLIFLRNLLTSKI